MTYRHMDFPQHCILYDLAGGHTAEMLKLVNSLDKKVYSPRVYVSAETDKLSGKKAFEAEKGYQTDVSTDLQALSSIFLAYIALS